MSDLVRLAALNNAQWCHAMARAHGCRSDFDGPLWINPDGSPPFYPNVVTLEPAPHGAVEAALPVLRSRLGAFALKDSFNSLDLVAHGLEPLFDANWIVRQPHASAATDSALDWHVVDTDEALLAFESAWAGGNPGPERLFLPSLLANPAIAFIAGARNGETIAGAVLNRSAACCGWSNVFDKHGFAHFGETLAFAATIAGDLPLVGYERDDTLTESLAHGFETIGALRIWAYREP